MHIYYRVRGETVNGYKFVINYEPTKSHTLRDLELIAYKHLWYNGYSLKGMKKWTVERFNLTTKRWVPTKVSSNPQ